MYNIRSYKYQIIWYILKIDIILFWLVFTVGLTVYLAIMVKTNYNYILRQSKC